MLKKRVFCLLPLLFLCFFAESATVFGAITGLEVRPPTVSTSRGEEISKILKVLENKMGDQKITPKTLDKLHSLSDEQIGLIVTLSTDSRQRPDRGCRCSLLIDHRLTGVVLNYSAFYPVFLGEENGIVMNNLLLLAEGFLGRLKGSDTFCTTFSSSL